MSAEAGRTTLNLLGKKVTLITLGNASQVDLINFDHYSDIFILFLQHEIEKNLNIKILSVSFVPRGNIRLTSIYFVHEPLMQIMQNHPLQNKQCCCHTHPCRRDAADDIQEPGISRTSTLG